MNYLKRSLDASRRGMSNTNERDGARLRRWLMSGSLGVALGVSASPGFANTSGVTNFNTGNPVVLHPTHLSQGGSGGTGTSGATGGHHQTTQSSQSSLALTPFQSGTSGSTSTAHAFGTLGHFQSLTVSIGDKNKTVSLTPKPVDLNLSSAKGSVAVSSISNFSNTSINVDGKSVAVTSSSILTQSEAVAVSQVLDTGHQSLLLNPKGSADGGSISLTGGFLSLPGAFANQLDGLVVPTGVTVVDKISAPVTLNLSYGLSNSGQIEFLPTGNQSPAVTINASSVLNSGTISSQSGDININTPTVTNSGTIQAVHGSVSIQNNTGNSLTVDNSGGKILASNAVNLTGGVSGNSSQSNSLNVQGGYLSGKSVNFNSPNGNVTVNVNQIDGPVNVSGANGSIGAQNGSLVINSSSLKADPLYMMMNGDLAVAFSDTAGQPFTALAGGNITLSGTANSLTTDGGNVLIAAGVTFSVNGITDTGTVTGASTTGGSIELPTVNITTSGGNVTLVADAGTTTGSGGGIAIGNISSAGGPAHLSGGNVQITSANTTKIGNINSSGADSDSGIGGVGGNGGNVTITQSGTASLSVGNIDTHGGASGAGQVGNFGTGGDGGDGGDGSMPTMGGSGGAGGMSGGYQVFPSFPPVMGGPGGISDMKGTAGGTAPGGTNPVSGGGKGGDGGDSSTSQNPGNNGNDGEDGLDGNDGGSGVKGGSGGVVAITTGGSLIVGSITTTGGAGGVGGIGGQGGFGGDAGGGGAGGNKFLGDPHNLIVMPGATGPTGAIGGNGGNGGDGGGGGGGGTGGNGGDAGNVTIRAGGSVTFTNAFQNIDAQGGAGGQGGLGGFGGWAGAGGNGGRGGGGGAGQDGGSQMTGVAPGGGNEMQWSQPGNGGIGGAAGNGGNGGTGGDGGDGGDGGAGGGGGAITIISGGNINASVVNAITGQPTGSALYLNFSVSGGAAGRGGNGGAAGVGGNGGGGNTGGQGGPQNQNIDNNANDPGLPSTPLPPNLTNTAGMTGANGAAGNGGDGGNSGSGGKGGDGGTNGSVVITSPGSPGSILLSNVDGTAFTNSNYHGIHQGPPAPGQGGAPATPDAQGGAPGSNPTNMMGTPGMPGMAGSTGNFGGLSIAGSVTESNTPPPPPPPPPPVVHHPIPVVNHPPPPVLHLGSSGLLSVPYAGVSTLDFNSVLASSGALTMNALPTINASLNDALLASTDDSSLLATENFFLKDVTVSLGEDDTSAISSDDSSYSAPNDPNVLHGYVATKVHGAKSQSGEHHGDQATIVKHLESGALLLSPHSETIVETAFGTVRLAPKSLALIIASPQQLAIYDLHDDHNGGVTVNAGHNCTVMHPGHSLVLNKGQCDSFELVNPIGYVGYRHVTSKQIDDSTTAFQGEFHMLSLVSGLEPLRKMVSSPKSEEKHVSDRLLRTISLLSTMSNSMVPFELKEPPAMAAMVPTRNSH
jgi:hypothetical protein